MCDTEKLAEAERLAAYYQREMERQRAMNTELRSAVAELARTFQETLAAAVEAADTGDMAQVRRIAYANKANWQAYLSQIVQAAQHHPK